MGTKVRFKGREGTVVGRVLSGEPSYDIRLQDGTIVKYVAEADLEPVPA
ncbi:hypothetical protein [Oleisolibacter albus]|nr:hypothetical protein [Oleisolibacter albus]